MRTDRSKSSAIERAEKKETFDKSLNKRSRHNNAGHDKIEVTSWMGGTVKLHLLNATNQGKPFLLAELNFRDHKTWREMPATQKAAMKEKELRHLLREIERTRLDEEDGINIPKEDVAQITEIKSAKIRRQTELDGKSAVQVLREPPRIGRLTSLLDHLQVILDLFV